MKDSSSHLSSLAGKTIVVIASMIFTFLAVASAMSIAYFMEEEFYSEDEWSYYNSASAAILNRRNAAQIAERYYVLHERYEAISQEIEKRSQNGEQTALLEAEIAFLYPQLYFEEARFSADNTNMRFSVRKSSGEMVLSTFRGEDYGAHDTFLFDIHDEEYGIEGTIEVDIYVVRPFQVSDEYSRDAFRQQGLYVMRRPVISILIGSTIGLILSMVYMILGAGYRSVDGKVRIVQAGLHQVPLDILWILGAGVFYLILSLRGVLVTWFINRFEIQLLSNRFVANVIISSITASMLWGVLLFLAMSTAIQHKTHSLPGNLWLYRQIVGFRDKKRRKTMIHQGWQLIKWSLVFLAVTLGGGYVFFRMQQWGLLILYLVVETVAIVSLLYGYQMRQERLEERIHRIAQGEIVGHINTEDMIGILRKEAEDLNMLDEVLQNSINERTRSERMKTELITNVSHDIKTPLTSIINYVDLLEREDPAGYSDKQKDYLRVLSAESSRLKRLIEDLIEAAKVSSGNINVEMAPLDLTEMILQVSGEYQEELESLSLHLTAKVPQEACEVITDGALLWRVLANFMSNVRKYAKEDSEVSLNLRKEDGFAQIEIVNVSKYPLELSEEELMERFVRGDASRHTEGSGLGLSIAKNLTERIGGVLHLHASGDIFAAVVSFPLAIGIDKQV